MKKRVCRGFLITLMDVLPKLDKHLPEGKQGHEIIFIDDGSTDNSMEILKGFEKENSSVRVFFFRVIWGRLRLDIGL